MELGVTYGHARRVLFEERESPLLPRIKEILEREYLKQKEGKADE